MTDATLQIFCALLARDPLPAQRFTDIETRMQQLANLAVLASSKLSQARSAAAQDETTFRQQSAAQWNGNLVAVPDIRPQTKNAPLDASDCAPAEADLISQMGRR